MDQAEAGLRMRALLVDDEESAIQWLADLLGQYPLIQVVGTATSVAKAESLLSQLAVDVVFLDIEMPRRRGFELFAKIDKKIRVVMVTAHNNFALQGYDFGAVDYLLKPVSSRRLTVTIERLIASRPIPPTHFKFAVPTARGIVLLEPDQILWIEARENYSHVHLADDEPLLVRRTLNEWSKSFRILGLQELIVPVF